MRSTANSTVAKKPNTCRRRRRAHEQSERKLKEATLTIEEEEEEEEGVNEEDEDVLKDRSVSGVRLFSYHSNVLVSRAAVV